MKALHVYGWWRAGFVSFRGALELLGVPVLYTRREAQRLVEKLLLNQDRLRAREEDSESVTV